MALFPHPIKCEKGKICFRTSHRLVVLEYLNTAQAVNYPQKAPLQGMSGPPWDHLQILLSGEQHPCLYQGAPGQAALVWKPHPGAGAGINPWCCYRVMGSSVCSFPCPICAGQCAPHPRRVCGTIPAQIFKLGGLSQLDYPISAMGGVVKAGEGAPCA